MSAPLLFSPLQIRSVTLPNRIAVSPMCQYSADTKGFGSDWHIQHLGARAMGGAGIVMTEATHVSAEGRITNGCLGLYTDAHEALMARLAALITSGGAVLDAAAELRPLGAELGPVICVIDRESGGVEKLAAAGLDLSALFTMSELNAAAE